MHRRPALRKVTIALQRENSASILGNDTSKNCVQQQKSGVERYSKSPTENYNTDGRQNPSHSGSTSENSEQRHKTEDDHREGPLLDVNDKLELMAMMERSAKENLKAHPLNYRALTESVVDSITSLCTSLEVNTTSKYRAIELYDRFVIRSNDDLYRSTKTMSKLEKEVVIQRIASEARLRMCTCILLASKLHSDPETPIVTTDKIKELLGKVGFSLEFFVRSEVRVMKTLNSRLNWVTPFQLVEEILCLFNLAESVQTDVHRYCMLFLEICYQFHLDLYRKLWKTKRASKPKSSLSDADDITYESYKRIKAEFQQNYEFNIPLRSASIVSCSLLLVNPGTDMRLSCKELSQMTSLCGNDIYDLATLMFSIVCD